MSRTTTKKSQSGLGSVQRDWSDPKFPQSSQEMSIPWDPTPPPGKAPLSAAEQRLKAIEAALAEVKKPPTAPLAPSRMSNKRSSDEFQPPSKNNESRPAKKPRQLPASWTNDTLSSTTAYSKPSSSLKIKKQPPMVSSTTLVSAAPTSTSKSKVAGIFLSHEQNRILELVRDGHSLFYTGSAGTGKSVLLREIIKVLRRKHMKSSDAVAITASTGIAACNIGGVTIHSFAGIGLGNESADALATFVKKNKKATTRWQRTKVLIIDEVSMVEADLFDKLFRVAQIIRRKTEPFGGIQLIVTGDFFQLPPVTRGTVKFAFEAQYWDVAIKNSFNLTKVFRQTDQEFVDMLNEMRFGRLSSKSIARFRSLSRPIHYDDGLGATELFPRREDVDRSNSARLVNLHSETRTYRASDGGTLSLDAREKALGNFMAVATLTLKVDSQVMLIKNMDDNTLVNGSMGRVISFVDPNDDSDPANGLPSSGAVSTAKKSSPVGGIKYPKVEFLIPNGGKREMVVKPESFKIELPDGTVQASRNQLPLILAWAMSIHKSQGQTLDRVKVDLGKVFEKGQAYVALSRATSLEGLQVLNFDPTKVMAHPKVAEWSKTLQTIADK